MVQEIVTGNDYVSLPEIDGATAAIKSISFLYMQAKGMYLLRGNAFPFMRPYVAWEGRQLALRNVTWSKLNHWIPQFTALTEAGLLKGTLLAPEGERGFMLRLQFKTCKKGNLTLGFDGEWSKTIHETNESFLVESHKKQWIGWYDAPVYAMVEGIPKFVFSYLTAPATVHQITETQGGFFYDYTYQKAAEKDEEVVLDIALGLGFDAVASVTSAIEMMRKTFVGCLSATQAFLAQRTYATGNALADYRLNYNLFFSWYFAAGKTLDTEELVMVTSRSPRYYVSAAYWDRDGLLWAFPAILQVDKNRAKELLDYVFTRQIRNVGIHSRFIDGTVLEPGFELDELCAPAVALCNYARASGDKKYLSLPHIMGGIEHILSVLQQKRHKDIALYETFLYPSDDMHLYPYLTYDNALVAHTLVKLAQAYQDVWEQDKIDALNAEAQAVKDAIYEHCVTKHNGRKLFAWCVDLRGNKNVYDEPPGSLVLLPTLGLCKQEDELYYNTVARLYRDDYPYSYPYEPYSELGCAHYAQPWVMSFSNSILAGRNVEKAVENMLKMPMDSDLACESIHCETGIVTSGNAFATCAGYYAYALMQYYK